MTANTFLELAMTRSLLALILACLFMSYLKAAPPECTTKEKDGSTFEVCHRVDGACESLAKEQLKDPSDKWNGCAWGATFIKGHFTAAGLMVFSTSISLVPSYRDSERMDVKVTFEQADHTRREYERKDVPIIIRNNIPSASFEIVNQEDPLGVPTAEMTEKGGKKEARHEYR
jgi:hypothetical protein